MIKSNDFRQDLFVHKVISVAWQTLVSIHKCSHCLLGLVKCKKWPSNSSVGLSIRERERERNVLFNVALKWSKRNHRCSVYRKEGNVLFNDALNTFYLQLYGEIERNVLFNDALNTFYLWLYDVRHMVKDHSDSEKGNPLPPHRLLLSINSKGSFICAIPQTG